MALIMHPVSVYELVHATRAQGRPDSIHHSNTGIDVTDELGFPLTCVSSLFQKDDLRLLQLHSL